MASFLDGVRLTGRLFSFLEKWVLVILLTFLVGFALLQIILRNFFSTGIVWSDNLLRHIVLWASFLGAARATSERKHIRIDILPRLLPLRGKLALEAVSSFFSFAICVILFYVSWTFVGSERYYGDLAFASVPVWWMEAIFPFSFAVMSIRFGCRFIESLGMKKLEAIEE